MSNLRSAALVFAVAGVLSPARVFATYSIVATDRATRQVGGAVTSCVNGSVAGVYGSAPGRGAVAAQALSNVAGRDRAVQLLLMDASPTQIITQITSAAFDPLAARRQYGVADLMGRADGHSGATNGIFASDIQGQTEPFTYSIQGNILTGMAVLTQAEVAFRGEACDLAERLMRALEAGANNNQGDRRCTPRVPSTSASIQVDRPDEPPGTFLRLSVVPDAQRSNPIPRLRAQLEVWRRTNPCPGAPPPPDAAPLPPDASARDAAPPPPGPDAGGPGNGNGGSPAPRPPDSGGSTQGGPLTDASSGSTGAGGNGGPSGSPGSGGSPGSVGSPGSAGGSPPPAQTPDPTPAGCECRTGSGRPGPAVLLSVAWALLLGRRRRRR